MIHRQATAEDLARIEETLRRLAETPGFDHRNVTLQDREFATAGVAFQFVSITGSPYLPRVTLLKYPVTRRQYSLFQPEWAENDFTDPLTPPLLDKNEQPATNMSWCGPTTHR